MREVIERVTCDLCGFPTTCYVTVTLLNPAKSKDVCATCQSLIARAREAQLHPPVPETAE